MAQPEYDAPYSCILAPAVGNRVPRRLDARVHILQADIRINCQITGISQGHKSLTMWSEAFETVSDRDSRRRDMAKALYHRTVRGILYS